MSKAQVPYDIKIVEPYIIKDDGNKKPPSERKYLFIYYAEYDGEEDKSWELITGRSEAFKFAKRMLPVVDVESSRVIVDGLEDLDNALTIKEFVLKMCELFEEEIDTEFLE